MATAQELGPKGFGGAVGASWKSFLGAVDAVVEVDERAGIEAAIPAFTDTLQGKANPAVGIIIRP